MALLWLIVQGHGVGHVDDVLLPNGEICDGWDIIPKTN